MGKRKSTFDRWLAEGRLIVSELNKRKRELERELEKIASQLAAWPNVLTKPSRRGPAARGKRGGTRRRPVRAAAAAKRTVPRRRRRGPTLSVMVQEVLGGAGRPMSIKEIQEAVLRKGYQTRAKTIYNAVYTSLQSLGAQRVDRGKYVLGGSSGRRTRKTKKKTA